MFASDLNTRRQIDEQTFETHSKMSQLSSKIVTIAKSSRATKKTERGKNWKLNLRI